MINYQTQERMPHVRFEQKDWGTNVQATKDAGVHIPNRSTFIVITSHGSKDSTEHLVDEWLPRKRNEAARGMYNMQWVEQFERAYKAWKGGHEITREGTAITTWQALSPEQNARMRAMGYQVVEDLSALPDSALGQLGLDGREIRDMARAWLQEGKDKGVNARLIAEQSVTIENLKAIVENQQAQLNELKAQLGSGEQLRRGPGRPRKDEYAIA